MGKFTLKPAEKRDLVTYVQCEHKVSERLSCRLIGISRRVNNYVSVKNDDEIILSLRVLVERHPGYGFWKLYHLLRNEGKTWNHKRVHRVYRQMKLNIRRKAKKRLPARDRQPLVVPKSVNQTWSMDFVSDSLWDGRRYRVLNIIDDYTREALAMECTYPNS